MTDLAEFIRAQLDHDERLARIVADRYIDIRDGSPYWPLPSVVARFRGASPEIAAGLDLIRLNGPEHTLRRLAAYRRILARHSGDHFCGRDSEDSEGLLTFEGLDPVRVKLPCGNLRDLASIYSDRPGFDPSWTVE